VPTVRNGLVKVFETRGGESVIAIADCLDTLAAVADSGGCNLVLMSPPYLDARTYGANVTWHFEDAVRCFCPPGGLVCDPMVGSGTSALASVRHGRRFVGGDLYKRESDRKPWARVAHERVLIELRRMA